mgnify:CR=1 FL=1
MEIIVLDNPNAEKKMEKEVQKKTEKLISDISPEKYLVYFPLANILNNLDVEQHFGFLQSNRNFQFNVFDIFSSLVFARAVAPCSKYKTFHDVLPSLFKEMNYSYDQLLDAVEFVGSEYEKLVEIFTVATKENYGTDTSHSFFDCTNFFFEIDKENDFQRRGPSKENKNDSIVGMGLLLDANIIPIGKKMYPGNESEKPILRNIIQDMKNQNNISGRTIQIADKGLNCARNIIQAVNNSDGYIFSKSVKQLSEKEKVWVLLNNDYKDVKDEYGNTVYRYKSCIEDFDYSYKDDDGKIVKKTIREKRVCTYNPKLARKKLMEIDKMVEKARNLKTYSAKKSEYGESGKYITITSNDGDHPIVTLNEEAIKKDRDLAGYNMLVTSEIKMKDVEIYDAYQNSIKGHFLICYVTILLTRILQFKVLDNKYSTSKICEFYRNFRLVKVNDKKYINITRASEFITELGKKLNQPLTNYYLADRQIKMMHAR